MASNKNSKAKQFNIKNNDRRYIIEKYNTSLKYDSYENNINKRYDDYYILHSLKNIVNKINTLKNNDIKVLLVSMSIISINEFRKAYTIKKRKV